MKSSKRNLVLCIALSILMVFSALSLSGCNGSSGGNWLSGTDTPETSWGNDGDMYMDTDDGDLYRKVNGQWQKIANIRGPSGSGSDSVKNARIENGELILVMANGTEVSAGSVSDTSQYKLSLNNGVLSVIREQLFEDLNSEAFGGLSFNDIFVDGNMLDTGNMLSHADIATSKWTPQTNAPSVSSTEFSTAPSSLSVTGGDKQLRYVVPTSEKGELFLASQVKVTAHTAGFAGMYSMVGTSVNSEGMKDALTTGYSTATQLINYNNNSTHTICVGSGGSANLTAYIDNLVLVNLTKIFDDEIPDHDTMRKLYTTFIRMFMGETNIVVDFSFVINMGNQDEPETSYTDSDYKRAFFNKMAYKARSIGIDIADSTITSAIGLSTRSVTVQDFVKIGIHASGYDELNKIWNKPTYTATTQNNVKTFTVTSTVVGSAYSHYLTDHYFVLGGKTGSLSETDNRSTIVNLLAVVEGPNDAIFVGMIAHEWSGSKDSEQRNRFKYAKVLFDIASRLYLDPTADISDLEALFPSDAGEITRASVVVLPPNGNILGYQNYDWFGENSRYHLYSTANAKEKIYTASTWKVLTCITALDYIDDLNAKVTVKADELSSSTPQFEGGETMSYRDALHFIMLPSSNTSNTTIARHLGERILKEGL